MEEVILDILKMENRAYSVQELFDKMNLQTTEQFKELLKIKSNLKKDYLIFRKK